MKVKFEVRVTTNSEVFEFDDRTSDEDVAVYFEDWLNDKIDAGWEKVKE